MRKQRFIGIDLFSGAGGMSLGAELAGISVQYAVEKDIHAAQTYQLNHPNTTMLNSDIREITSIPINIEDGITVLFGGVPCQGFSTSNRRTNNRSNEDNWLYKEFIRIILLWQPDWAVFENVTGIVEMESGVFFREIMDDFRGAGYTISYTVLNAADFAVPQRRKRLFLIGSKYGRTINFCNDSDYAKVTVRDALYDLPNLSNGANIDILPYACRANNKYAKAMRKDKIECAGHLVSKNAEYILDRYKHIKQGENWKSVPREMMSNYVNSDRCHTGIYHRLREDDVSVVIGNYRKNMLIHPWSDRGLSVREAARLQSFPDDYIFSGSIGFQQQQVGNAVPPLLAKAVFNIIVNEEISV